MTVSCFTSLDFIDHVTFDGGAPEIHMSGYVREAACVGMFPGEHYEVYRWAGRGLWLSPIEAVAAWPAIIAP